MKKPSTAVIGVGNMGKKHVKTYSEIQDINLVAVVDIDEEAGKKVAKDYNCRFYSTHTEMIEKEKLDIVSVATPTSTHKEIAVDCMNKKINVLLEKPISDSLEDAREIMECVIKNNVKLMVGYVERFNPAVIKLNEIIKDGHLGKVKYAVFKRVGPLPPQARESNVILDLATHDIDLSNFLFEKFPKIAACHKAMIKSKHMYDSLSLILCYKPDAYSLIETNWITPIKIRELKITGNSGYAELDFINQTLVCINNDGKKREITISKEQPLRLEILAFINCVKFNLEPEVTLRQSVDTLRTALEAMEWSD